MSIKIGDIRYPDKHSRFIVKRIQGNKLYIEMKSMTSDEPGFDDEISVEEFLKLPTSPIKKVINTNPGFAGLLNNTYSCFINSIFQSIIRCNPLREKIMKIKVKKESGRKNSECRHDMMENFIRVIYMLLSQTGSININFFYESLRTDFSRVDDPAVFLDFIYENLFNCGYITKKSQLTQLEGLKYDLTKLDPHSQIRAIAEHSKSCLILPTDGEHYLLQNLVHDIEQFIILPDEQEFIILASNGFVPVRLPPNGIITIHHHHFKISSVLVRAGGREGSVGHFYTVTLNGRFDDDTVEESEDFMIGLVSNGYDMRYDMPNYGYLFFFEKIIERGLSGIAAEHPFRPSASSHSGIAAEPSFGSSARGHFGMAAEPSFGSSARGHFGMAAEHSFQTGTEDLLPMYIRDAGEDFDEYKKQSDLLKKKLNELASEKNVGKIKINLKMVNKIVRMLEELMVRLENINRTFQNLFGISQRSERLIMMNSEMDEIRRQIKEIERKLQVLGDEELARQFVGKQGGNVNYKNKYLLYKEKYLLLKKKMNN